MMVLRDLEKMCLHWCLAVRTVLLKIMSEGGKNCMCYCDK